MTIRTEAIDLLNNALAKIKFCYDHNFDKLFMRYKVDDHGNIGYGIDVNGIKYCIGRASEDKISWKYWTNLKYNTIVIPVTPEVYEACKDLPMLQVFYNYMQMVGDVIIHELVHLLHSKTPEYKERIYDKSNAFEYYNDTEEKLAYAAEIYSNIEKYCDYKDNTIKRIIDKIEDRKKFRANIKKLFSSNIHLDTFLDYLQTLTEDNYKWFIEYVKSEYNYAKSLYTK